MLDLLTSVKSVSITLEKAVRRATIIYIKHHGEATLE